MKIVKAALVGMGFVLLILAWFVACFGFGILVGMGTHALIDSLEVTFLSAIFGMFLFIGATMGILDHYHG